MDGQELAGLFEALGSTFDAAAAREEREAADDLAMSLRQDRTIVQVLASGAWSVREGELVTSLLEVGLDYALTDRGSFIPLGALVASASYRGSSPVQQPDTLLERLRHLARAGGRVLVEAGRAQMVEGTLLAAGRDHLLVRDARGIEHLIASTSVERVSRPRGSSADVP